MINDRYTIYLAGNYKDSFSLSTMKLLRDKIKAELYRKGVKEVNVIVGGIEIDNEDTKSKLRDTKALIETTSDKAKIHASKDNAYKSRSEMILYYFDENLDSFPQMLAEYVVECDMKDYITKIATLDMIHDSDLKTSINQVYRFRANTKHFGSILELVKFIMNDKKGVDLVRQMKANN